MARFSREARAQLQGNAEFTTERLGRVPGVEVIVPQGAMYVMVRRGDHRRTVAPPPTPSRPAQCKVDVDALDGVADDMEFTQKLLDEESVFVLPGRVRGRGGGRWAPRRH